MSSRQCDTCSKTVYINEKIDIDGHWYHRFCFKCAVPGCQSNLTIKNFQKAVLDKSKIDPSTNRPMKELVCEAHVPKFTSSSYTPPPSKIGTGSTTDHSSIHRSLMGRPSIYTTINSSLSSTTSDRDENEAKSYNFNGSPRKTTSTTPKVTARFLPPLSPVGTTTAAGTKGGQEEKMSATITPPPLSAEDDSFRTLPVSHTDYDSTRKEGKETIEDEDHSFFQSIPSIKDLPEKELRELARHNSFDSEEDDIDRSAVAQVNKIQEKKPDPVLEQDEFEEEQPSTTTTTTTTNEEATAAPKMGVAPSVVQTNRMFQAMKVIDRHEGEASPVDDDEWDAEPADTNTKPTMFSGSALQGNLKRTEHSSAF